MLLQFEPSTWEKSDSQIFESAIETAKKIATNTEQTELSPDLLAISRIAGISLIHDLKIMRIEKDYVRKEAFLRNNVMNPAFVTNILRIVPGHCVRGELLPSGMVIYLHSEDFERFRKTKTSIVGNDEGQGELWLSSVSDDFLKRVVVVDAGFQVDGPVSMKSLHEQHLKNISAVIIG
ncbi:MAG: hypothetical protein GYA55_12820 [SAR324 cluster bacterium]|uniref:Uncharacterized protein n=1 Tax=SAR324 cluster bacterium TaxID=2024889 RepID=A0A7X9FUC8_9DELT|nr:hypothetical protein [SAR324 cluster bacterium]